VRTKQILGLIIVLGILALLLQLDYSKVEGGSYEYYINNWKEIGVPNLVTAILADWRGYDTLGEATILFTAIIGVYTLLGVKKK
jgi:multisubunit Na+/H+ antiporter MnhB subunit